MRKFTAVPWLWVGVIAFLSGSSRVIPAELPQSAIARAQALNHQGIQSLERGHAETALDLWRQAEAAYKVAGDETGRFGSQLNQVQALQSLGHYRRARTLLNQLNASLQPLPESLLTAESWRSLGIALFRIGDRQESYKALRTSLRISQHLKGDSSSTLMALGNVVRVPREQLNAAPPASVNAYPAATAQALTFYQQAATQSTDSVMQLQASVNRFSLLIETNQIPQALALLEDIQALLRRVSPSRVTVYAQVNVAESLIQLSRKLRDRSGTPATIAALSPTAIAQLLAQAVQQARTLTDQRAEAYAVGQLGHLYEFTQQWAAAERLTQQALQLTQTIQADDIAVSWYWQLGRILRQQGRSSAAIVAYQQAVERLSKLRGDLVAINPDLQFSFREDVEPIYRQLVQLLLEGTPTQAALKQARSVIEALQLAELNNFFREACLDAKPQQIDQVDPNAAVIYSIILPDRLAVILSLPNQPLRYTATTFAAAAMPKSGAVNQPHEVEQVFDDLLATLNPFVADSASLQPHQQLYDWMIRPIAADLEQHQIKTLVFVMDGILRGVPIAALHDGRQYLIEQYRLALTPGMQLLPPRSLPSDQLRILAGGLSEARQGFSSLPGVAQEMQEIANLVPSNILLNQTFTLSQLTQKLEKTAFPILHLATHGQFSSQSEKTFLLTWDGQIKVNDLDQLVEMQDHQNRQSIELLILSACQTAVGDKRAALGLAGVALRSGARSTIATLWSVQDQSTAELIAQFYTALKQPGMTRAEALRQAQLSLLRSPDYRHPYYWAPFVLVGNWQ